jgi:hypothetical protein
VSDVSDSPAAVSAPTPPVADPPVPSQGEAPDVVAPRPVSGERSERRSALRPTIGLLSLVAANLVPLVGALFFDWGVFAILLLFWLENVVVGAFNVLAMAIAQGSPPPTAVTRDRRRAVSGPKLFLIPFFCVHYGIFVLVHGVLVVVLFGSDANDAGGTSSISAAQLGLGLVALVVSHAISFFRDYVASGRYLATSAGELFQRPYGRVVVMHVTIIFGGWAALALGSPVWALALLVVLKIGLDARGYLHQLALTASPVQD